jgi:hypothetical protein
VLWVKVFVRASGDLITVGEWHQFVVDRVIRRILGDTLQLAGGLLMVGNFSTLVNRVEGLEVEKLDTGMGASWVTDGRTMDTSIASWFSVQEA